MPLRCPLTSKSHPTGYFHGTIDFDPSGMEVRQTSAGQGDIYIHVLDRTGALQWAQAMGGPEYDQGLGVAVAADGAALLSGLFLATADFDPLGGTFALTSLAGDDLFLTRPTPPRMPTAVQLVDNRVLEDQAPGTPIGPLSATDPDAGDQFTYQLVSGSGDTDNSLFRVDGEWLWTQQVFDYDVQNSYSVRVRVIDSSGLGYEQQLTVNVLPTAQAATVSNPVWHDVDGDGLQDVGEGVWPASWWKPSLSTGISSSAAPSRMPTVNTCSVGCFPAHPTAWSYERLERTASRLRTPARMTRWTATLTCWDNPLRFREPPARRLTRWISGSLVRRLLRLRFDRGQHW